MEKSEIDLLFPEVEVEGVKVRPWSLGQVVDLAPVLAAIAKGMKEQGITLENIEARIDDLVLLLIPHAAKIICVSTRLKEEEIREWPINRAALVVMAIIERNVEHIKNSFGLGRAKAEQPQT